MTDHFSIDVDTAELSNAMTKFGWLAEQLGRGGEGGKLGKLSGDSGGWTGEAATACLGEMTTISTTMTGAAPKFTAAHDAVQTFRSAVETAKNDTLPKLNTQWSESVTAYNTAVGSANHTYSSTSNDYRHMPPDDSAGPLKEAQTKRDKALTEAGTTRDSAQKTINGDYDAMITTLKTAAKSCGDALAGAVVITFTAEQWSKVKGGGPIPLGLKFQLRAEAFGPDTILHHSDGIVVGDYVGSKLNDEAKNGVPGDPVDPEVAALMTQFGGDKAFVEGLMTTVGPGGMAYLSHRVRTLYQSGDDGKKQGQALLNTLTTIYATGSHITVQTDAGYSKPLMDEGWLDKFNPATYSSLSDSGKRWFTTTAQVQGYRPDLLLPFLNKPGVSAQFAQLVAQRALSDYEAAQNLDDQEALRRWQLYVGGDDPINGNVGMRNAMLGDSSDPFRTELFHIALDRASDYASSSNALMLTHRDSMLTLMTGAAPWLTGGGDGAPGHDWGSAGLAKILRQATIGEQGSDVVAADGALWGVADYLNSHGGHLVNNVQLALGDVITDPRMFNGAVTSVTTPFGPATGYRDDSSNPQLGPLMSPDLWATLHQEGMLQPKTAATLIKEFGAYIDTTTNGAQSSGYVWNPETKKFDIQAPENSSISYFQAEAARHFLGQNLLVDHDALVKTMEAELEKNKQNKDQAKAIVGQMIDWAKDPTSIKGDVIDKLTNFAVDKAVDWAFPSTAEIQAKYNDSIASLQKNLDSEIVDPTFWTDVNDRADQLVRDISDNKGTSTLLAPPANGSGGPSTYNGDPTKYVGQTSEYQPGSGHVITDDFLTYGADGKPNGVVPVDQMNNLQQKAYDRWLHDPSVQKYFDGSDDAITKARQRATR